ncbi:gliding motility-associated peptidyl-prolyl isomerase GldI [Ichthyenterobacterium sp. W332]|uniref:Peptidyl-prolyl cis-trans isomerase n=1 Tax=Microcosmobacter mediterraneus TaxID=3075607 RepID=A0ABU2YHC9_9FLAO|nr:gliding motility-associated peptidyl-prolyl isomerase GldI [Ichthyenterobacterium sp. W332]MDT0557190.1 gliding motility-associated peptidyl-prolyl isomerase GldI [Ichthyenterobacterium sp. W332]
MKQVLNLLIIALIMVSCKPPEARLPISVSSGSFIQESAERNKKLNEKERSYIKQLIDKDTEHNYIASESGFWYYYHTRIEADSIQPSFGDLIQFKYNVKDLDGREIYSENEIGVQQYTMDQEELFTGLREGLKLMKPSETVIFIFPSQKAYGYYGDTNKIGTNIPLVCKVTLNSITQKQK